MGIEQISNAMQRNCGFTGTGAAFYHHHAAGVIADNLVLLPLNGLHNGGHVARAGSLHSVIESGFARYAGLFFTHARARQNLIMNAGDGAPFGPDLAAGVYAFWLGGGSEIEGPCHGGTPI